MTIRIGLFLVCVWTITIFGTSDEEFEPQTLLKGTISHGLYGGPVVKFTEIKGKLGLLVGGYGGWLINHTFMIGGGGYGLTNSIKKDYSPFPNDRLMMGYGGFMMEYFIIPKQLVHFSVNTLIGAGGIHYSNFDWNDNDWEDNHFDSDSFFILEPSLTLILNVSKSVRFGTGISYRYVSDLDYEDVTNKDIRGPSLDLFLQFGKY